MADELDRTRPASPAEEEGSTDAGPGAGGNEDVGVPFRRVGGADGERGVGVLPDFFLSERRLAAVVRLLSMLADGLPSPSRSPMSLLGFIHKTLVDESCPDCLANGFVSRDCETCGGHGSVEVRRTRDPYDTGAGVGWFPLHHERRLELDREIARVDAQLLPPASEADLLARVRGDRWERDRAVLRGRFDVEACERALEELALVDNDAYRAIYAVHVYGWLPDSGGARRLVMRGLGFVSVRLPRRLRVPPAAA